MTEAVPTVEELYIYIHTYIHTCTYIYVNIHISKVWSDWSRAYCWRIRTFFWSGIKGKNKRHERENDGIYYLYRLLYCHLLVIFYSLSLFVSLYLCTQNHGFQVIIILSKSRISFFSYIFMSLWLFVFCIYALLDVFFVWLAL